MEFDSDHINKLFNKLYNGLKEKIPHIVLNGDLEHRYKGNLNFSFSYVEGESLIMAVKDIAVSSGYIKTFKLLVLHVQVRHLNLVMF